MYVMEENQGTNGPMKNLGIVVAFIIIVLIIGTVAISKLLRKTENPQTAYSTQTAVYATPTNTPSPTIIDTSNEQLDQDVQSIQKNLDSVDTNLDTATQSINNQSADTPQ